MISSSMKMSTQTVKACVSAGCMLEAVRRPFGSLFITVFNNLYASHVRPRLEYGGPAIFLCNTTEILNLGRIQWYATRLVHGLRGIKYDVWLRLLKLSC